jgi:hypothetical protein
MHESLDFFDEKDRKEGEIIHRTLRLLGTEPHYIYVRSSAEMVAFINEFAKSEYRYLHLSCHGGIRAQPDFRKDKGGRGGGATARAACGPSGETRAARFGAAPLCTVRAGFRAAAETAQGAVASCPGRCAARAELKPFAAGRDLTEWALCDSTPATVLRVLMASRWRILGEQRGLSQRDKP